MNKIIDDNFLYSYMPQAEKNMLERIPPENMLYHQFSRRFKRRMKALIKYERQTSAKRYFLHQIRTAVATILIVLSIAFGTVMSVEAYRVRIFEFVTYVWEELTSIVIKTIGNTEIDTLIPIVPSYIPKGYRIIEQMNDKYENTIIYSNETGVEIYYLQRMLTQSGFILDSENPETEKIIIGSQEIYFILKNDTYQLYWHDDFSVFSLIGNIDKTELIKMATSIIK